MGPVRSLLQKGMTHSDSFIYRNLNMKQNSLSLSSLARAHRATEEISVCWDVLLFVPIFFFFILGWWGEGWGWGRISCLQVQYCDNQSNKYDL